jgi:hypothetical protein
VTLPRVLRAVPAVVLIVGAAVGGLWAYGAYQRHRGAEEATKQVEQKAARTLAESNRRWMATLASVRQQVSRETDTATSAVVRADTARAKRKALPPPLPTAPATDSIAYWRARAILAETESTDLRTAFEAQQRATAALTRLADTAASRVDSTTTALDHSLDREQGKHRGFLAWLPRPIIFLEGEYAQPIEQPGRLRFRGGGALAFGSVRVQAGVMTDRTAFIGLRAEF